ncbi:hypothetical protein M9Y10_001527 [Tritrichomonas musculus]|uniref:Protein kinase domain-containing protein n=1 Tax=Tritrichomonas musculus TaxID=1915356 RepID=A0ABR2L907_9EUKA
MADIIDITNLSIDPSQYTEIKDLGFLENDLAGHLKVVSDKSGKNYLNAEYDIVMDDDQKVFFRNISFLSHFSHPSIAKLKGFSFFGQDPENICFSILSEYPENGFLTEFIEQKVKKGIIFDFDDTAKSKFLFGAAFIGYYLHSRGIIHRCFAPPSFGVTKNYEPILMTMSSSKSSQQQINKTILGGNYNWTSPEVDDPTLITDSQYNDRTDVFSFGTIIYYLSTGNVPFGKCKNVMQKLENKKNAINFIDESIPEGLRNLLERCWEYSPENRPQFSEILTGFQCHVCLFPDTNLNEFDAYVKELFSHKTSNSVCKIASHNEKLINSVNTIYNSVINTYKLKYDSKILKALYTIREQTEEYSPLILNISRPGSNIKKWIRVPSFMFAASLFGEAQKIFGLPEAFQKIEVNNKLLIEEPFLTMEQLNIKAGDTLKVFNSFGSKALGSDILNLNIQDIGTVSISYMKDDTIDILKNDISFSTRIPVDTLKLKFKGKALKSGISLEELGIHKNDTIDVETSFPNGQFELTLDFIDGSNTIKTTVRPTTKIIDMMKKAGINTLNCFAFYNKEILSLYKSFNDYYIKEATTITIHSNKT